jgi:hypothetical protein
MPLAHASTLDRGDTLAVARVFVEAFWSPALVLRLKLAGKSSRWINSVNYRAQAGEGLSLSGGASIQFSVFFKLGITS